MHQVDVMIARRVRFVLIAVQLFGAAVSAQQAGPPDPQLTALTSVLRSRIQAAASLTRLDPCSVARVFGREVAVLDALPPDVRGVVVAADSMSCAQAAVPVGVLELIELRTEQPVDRGVRTGLVSFRLWKTEGSYGEERYQLRGTTNGEWRVTRSETSCCVHVHITRPVPGDGELHLILDGVLFVGAARDSAFARLKGAILESVVYHGAGEPAIRLFGSRASGGVLVITTKRRD